MFKPNILCQERDCDAEMVPKTPLQFGVAERLSRTFRAESTGIRAEAPKMLWSPGGSSDMSEGSKKSRSFEDSERSYEEYSEDRASSKEGGSETPQVRRSTIESRDPVRYTKSSIHLMKNLKICSWAKLVWILMSEGSLSLLKILGMKILAAMFTRLVMKESAKFYAASTGLRVN
nr:hypothetical protein [Tanacetum cinerariifolium]